MNITEYNEEIKTLNKTTNIILFSTIISLIVLIVIMGRSFILLNEKTKIQHEIIKMLERRQNNHSDNLSESINFLLIHNDLSNEK